MPYLQVVGQDGSSIPSSIVCSTTLQAPPTSQDLISWKVQVIQQVGNIRPEGHRGTEMVAGTTSMLEWETHHPTTHRPGDGNRCLPGRLGGSVQWHLDGRPMVSARETPTYQCVRVDSRQVCSPIIREGKTGSPRPFEDGQHVSPLLCKQNGGYPVPQTDRGNKTPVELVPSMKDNTVSLTPPRTEQPSSRPGIQTGSNLS